MEFVTWILSIVTSLSSIVTLLLSIVASMLSHVHHRIARPLGLPYISVFQTDGQFCYSMGEGKLSRYFDVMIVNSLLQVSDWSHHCIYTFTLDGHYCGKFAAKPQRKDM